jgi:hypothetical protein
MQTFADVENSLRAERATVRSGAGKITARPEWIGIPAASIAERSPFPGNPLGAAFLKRDRPALLVPASPYPE